MKLDILNQLQPVISKFTRYRVLIFTLLFLGIYAGMSYRITHLTSQEPTEEAVAERLKTVKRINVDKDSISKLKQLESQNIEVQTLFNQARQNPFTE